MNDNRRAIAAKTRERDEFYTLEADVAREVSAYPGAFEGKSVYCNCDNPWLSGFFAHFARNFDRLGLLSLTCTCRPIGDGDLPYVARVTRDPGIGPDREVDPDEVFSVDGNDLSVLSGDGDYASDECRELASESDVVVTNPPWRSFGRFFDVLLDDARDFLVVGPQNAITYERVFPEIESGRVSLGRGFPGNAAHFRSPYADVATSGSHREGCIRVSGALWYTTLDRPGRHEPIALTETYDPDLYPTYANYDAIEVCPYTRIPRDYAGVMGVPVTFLCHLSPDQFEVVGCDRTVDKTPMSEVARRGEWNPGGNVLYYEDPDPDARYRYRAAYKRILVRNLHPESHGGSARA